MTSEPARTGEISLYFLRIPSVWDENLPYKQAQVSQRGKVR